MQQSQDFWDETYALGTLTADFADADFQQETQFKQWTIDMILRHLLVWNRAAMLSLSDADGFAIFMKTMAAGVRGGDLPVFENGYLQGLSGRELKDCWLAEAERTAGIFGTADPAVRLPWVGPAMSARSSITARLMESWAHGQAIYDVLGQIRVDQDRIGNIVRLGVNTFDWTFRNRREDVPGPMPRLKLAAPSGVIWEYGEGDDCISGTATEFCQVVTQTRNVKDTDLVLEGPIAQRWMAIAQCFAGPPAMPPEPGSRFRTCK